jgi:transcriptional regulator with XRE-family HTH domain
MPTEDPKPNSRPFRARSAQDFGAAVKHFRTSAGITQADLAARAGLHRAYLSELEGGHATEAMTRLMALFRELGVRITIAQEEW